MNFLPLWKFKPINLFSYQIQYMKELEEFSFEFSILFGFDIFAIQPSFVFQSLDFQLYNLFIILFLQLLDILEILLISSYQFFEFSNKLLYRFDLGTGVNVCFIQIMEMETTIQLKEYMIGNCVFYIIIVKYHHQQNFYLIILFNFYKSFKIRLHDAVFSLSLAIYLRIKGI